MVVSPWSSALFGIALGAANAAVAYALFRVGVGRSQQAFLKIVFGGLVVRLVLVTALMGGVLLLVAVDRTAFVGGFFMALAVGIVTEIMLIQRHARRARQPQP